MKISYIMSIFKNLRIRNKNIRIRIENTFASIVYDVLVVEEFW